MKGSYIGAMRAETRDDWGTWLAQLVEHETLYLGDVRSILGEQLRKKKEISLGIGEGD